jgi:soluble lytic murein transglycosylase-like protein
MRIRITALIIFLAAVVPLSAQITVKQDKYGRIIVSNMDKDSHYKYLGKPKKSKYKKTPGTINVPPYYLAKIRKLAKRYKLKEKLILAVAKAESSFNPFAVSHKGAVGIMQLMPDTARQYGVYNRYNVDQNLEGGIRHLKYLYDKYKQNLPLTLAAYNAGEEAVKKYKGVPPYKETRNYIKRVLKYMGLSYNRFSTKVKQKIYKIVTDDGRVIITDRLPSKVNGRVSVIE